MSMIINWQTSLCGLALIILGVIIAGVKGGMDADSTGFVVMGIGLLRAKDGDQHSTQAQVTQATVEAK